VKPDSAYELTAQLGDVGKSPTQGSVLSAAKLMVVGIGAEEGEVVESLPHENELAHAIRMTRRRMADLLNHVSGTVMLTI